MSTTVEVIVKPEHLTQAIQNFRDNRGASLSCNCIFSMALAEVFPEYIRRSDGPGVPCSASIVEYGSFTWLVDDAGASIVHVFDSLVYEQLTSTRRRIVEWDGPSLPATVVLTLCDMGHE